MIKNRRNAIWLFVLGLLSFGCSDTKEREAIEPESQLDVKSTEIAIAAEGGEEAFQFTTNRGWGVTKQEDSWYDITSPVLGEAGEVTVNLKVQPNEGVALRTSNVTVMAGKAMQEVSLKQFGSQPEILLGTSLLNAGFAKATYDVLISSNVQVNALPSENWITIEQLTVKSSCTNVYKVTVEGNTGAERSGKIVFSGEGVEAKELVVNQAAFRAEVSVTNAKLDIGALQTEASVTIKANVKWHVLLEGTPDWVSIQGKAEGEPGTTVVKFKVTENPEKVARRCSFSIHYDGMKDPIKMTLVQAGNGSTREMDSSLLVSIWKAATNHGNTNWNLSSPIHTWTGVTLNGDLSRVRELTINGWVFPNGFPAELGWFEGLWKLTIVNSTFNKPELPADFGQAKNLQQFELSYCSPIDLPDMSQMTALRKLVIRGDISGFQGKEYQEVLHPERIGQLKGLTRLELLGTTITAIPEGVKEMVNLDYLSVNYSKVTAIPEWINQLAKLRYLYMEHCELTGNIPATVFAGQALLGLSFAFNKLSGTIPVEAFRMPNLVQLSLSENNLTGDLSEELVTSKIRDFSVRNNRLGSRGATTDLSEKILGDSRWGGSSGEGGGSGGWFGSSNICKQQTGYGWKNCPAN